MAQVSVAAPLHSPCRRQPCVGQKQKWFLLRLVGEEHHIRFDRGPKAEFDAWRWVSYWYPVGQVIDFKRDVYRLALKELARALPGAESRSARRGLMLEPLRRIVQEVNAAPDFRAVLEIIVERVKAAMNTGMCSIYLLDPVSKRYILSATRGLLPESVGKVTMSTEEGLVGLVASRAEPVNLEHAETHPASPTFPKPARSASAPFSARPSSTSAKCWACWWSSSRSAAASTRAKKPS